VEECSEWYPEKQPLYHCVISLIISQKISFGQSREIRRKIYEKVGKSIFIWQDIIKITDKEWKYINIDKNKKETIMEVTLLERDGLLSNMLVTHKIKGIGPWTIKATKIMTYSDDNIDLYEDLWIRKRMSEVYDIQSSQRACKEVFDNFKGKKSQLSRFLWRIKPQSIDKVRKCLSENVFLLVKDDFI